MRLHSDKSPGRGGFSHFQENLSPDCHGKTGVERLAERGLAVKAGRALVEFAVVTFYSIVC